MPPLPRIRITWTSAPLPSDVDEPGLRRALASFLEGLGHDGRGLSVWFAGDAELRELNHAWRDQDRPTDVLSWSYLEPGAAEDAVLGDLALSLDHARAQARENGWDLQTELVRLLAHGCAHLAGFDHESAAAERRMRGVEAALLEKAGFSGIYPASGKGAGSGGAR